MSEFNEIEQFLENVEEDPEFTGNVSETFCDCDLKIQINISYDDYQQGSFSILFNSEKSSEELAKAGAYTLADIEPRYEDVEATFNELIDEYLGYNAYEPVFDISDRDEEYDFVAHDVLTVFR
jgi:hypothetical protein